MADGTILFDLPGNDGKAWSINPWKARLLLNYKGIPYTTQWLEYPDVAPTLSSFGIPGNAQWPSHSIPAARLADGQYIMDSKKIADAVERLHPSPSVHLDEPVVAEVEDLVTGMAQPLRGVFIPQVPRILNPRSVEYFERTRAERLGMPLSQYRQEHGSGDGPWEAARPAAEKLAALLQKNADGPFFLGKTFSYADIYLVSALEFWKRIDEASFARILAYDKSFGEIFAASQKYLERQT